MEARTDRRAPSGPRIPLDVLVQLTHEDFEEPFDADGVDVSSGGLALRADYLPEVGDRLRCRFDCPPEGLELEVDGEVVWAHDAGERRGEFGLRFAELDLGAEEALSRLVEHLGGAPRAGGRARLHLEAVATPIDAEILDRDERSLTVEQELPFLRLGMRVSVEGAGPAHGRLASVDLRVEDGVPRLLLVVRDERAEVEPEPAAARERPPVDDDATLQDFEAPAPLARIPAARSEARREGVQDEGAGEEAAHDEAARDELLHDEDVTRTSPPRRACTRSRRG
ncbi:MAG: PilZ domain-containing protein [Sandaracinaceae bacterium]|nr:PilZ domain-containing protein [Sandaracinaceae bacterium]